MPRCSGPLLACYSVSVKHRAGPGVAELRVPTLRVTVYLRGRSDYDHHHPNDKPPTNHLMGYWQNGKLLGMSRIDTPSGGNDGLPRDFCAAGPTPDLRPGPPGGGTADHSHARVPGQLTPLRPSGLLTSRRHAESFYLIFLGGAVRISHPAILIPPPIKSVTWMPSSPNWGSSKSSSSRTTPRAHRPLTGHWPTPSAWPGWCC